MVQIPNVKLLEVREDQAPTKGAIYSIIFKIQLNGRLWERNPLKVMTYYVKSVSGGKIIKKKERS